MNCSRDRASRQDFKDAALVASGALAFIDESPGRVIPTDLERHLQKAFALSRRQARAAIRDLVAGGALSYRWELGHAFIERSFDRPVRVTEHIVLKPAWVPFAPGPEDAVVAIEAGAAFGTGRHPTTRLCLVGLDWLLRQRKPWLEASTVRVLDVGTGSGVLLLAALCLGAGRGLGIDRDPCAVYEAKKNAELNALSDRAAVSDMDIAAVSGTFDLLVANLRYPTLLKWAGRFESLLQRPGAAVLSGMKPSEADAVVLAYETLGFRVERREALGDWYALVLTIGVKRTASFPAP